MAMEGTLLSRNGKLYVLYAYGEQGEPYKKFLWYRVHETKGTGYGDRPGEGDIATYAGTGYWKTRDAKSHRGTGSLVVGDTAESVERVSVSPPSSGGKPIRWHDGRWEKLLARGWVPAEERKKAKRA